MRIFVADIAEHAADRYCALFGEAGGRERHDRNLPGKFNGERESNEHRT